MENNIYRVCENPWDPVDWKKIPERLSQGPWRGFAFPAYLLEDPEFREWALSQKTLFRVIPLLQIEDFTQLRWLSEADSSIDGLEPVLVLDQPVMTLPAGLLRLEQSAGLKFSILVRPQAPQERVFWTHWFENLPYFLRPRVAVEFAIRPGAKRKPWKAEQIQKAVAEWKTVCPDFDPKSSFGWDCWDSVLPASWKYEPVLEPEILWNISKPEDIQISIIIPHKDRSDFLLNCVRHLLNQTLKRIKYEIILVDDGSRISPKADLLRLLGPEFGNLNFQFFSFPRLPEETKRFRAGIARNIGRNHARGQIFYFLDSDMLIPPKHLHHLLRDHDIYDVIQSPRWHIPPYKSDSRANYDDLYGTPFLYIEEESHWGPFFRANSWGDMPDFWKYVCTYSLSVRKTYMDVVGNFRRTFTCYGLEDTDLGYRLYLQGARFGLSQSAVLHLTPPSKGFSIWQQAQRHMLLAQSASVFYQNHLHEDVYRVFHNSFSLCYFDPDEFSHAHPGN